MRLVVGLGNPGQRYARTRHNVGFRVADAVAAALGAQSWRERFEALVAAAPGADALIVKPQTFMNDSGNAVAALVQYYKLVPADVLVVCDDVSLPFARLRARRSGSDGGNRGLRSVIECLRTIDVPRLRVGIGRNSLDTVGYVLGVFSPEEETLLPKIIARAVDGVQAFLDRGIESTIALVNADGGDLPDEELADERT